MEELFWSVKEPQRQPGLGLNRKSSMWEPEGEGQGEESEKKLST